MSRTLAKFGLPFDKATPLVQFTKALKRPRNNVGPASVYIYIYIDLQNNPRPDKELNTKTYAEQQDNLSRTGNVHKTLIPPLRVTTLSVCLESIVL